MNLEPDFKSLFKSKTIWAAILYAVLVAFDKDIQTWIGSNPGITASLVSAGVIFLRLITKTGVKL